jgi:hypothetical protein
MLRAWLKRSKTWFDGNNYRRAQPSRRSCASRRLGLEQFEERILLWGGFPPLIVQLNGMTLQISASSSDSFGHSVRLQQDASNPLTQTDVMDRGAIVATFNNSSFNQISIALGTGNDTIDLGNVLMPSLGISLDGGAGSNTLLTGSETDLWSTSSSITGNNWGNVTFNNIQGLTTGSGPVNLSAASLAGAQTVNGVNVQGLSLNSLAVSNGTAYALSGTTVWEYSSSGATWTAITGKNTCASTLVAANGGLYMLANNGVAYQTVWAYSGSGTSWAALTGTNTSVASLIEANGGLYMLASNGSPYETVWQYSGLGMSWNALTGTNTNAATLVEANGGLYMLATNGAAYETVWQYSGSPMSWTPVTGTNTSALTLASLDGDLFMLGSNNGSTSQIVWQYTGSLMSWNSLTDTNNAAASLVLSDIEPVAGAAYSPVNSPVSGSPFGASGSSSPVYQDVQQGQEGDCWLLSSLAEVAKRYSQDITSMFTYDGTTVENGSTVDIYTVRFYNPNGGAEYFTVDTELPSGGGLYDSPVNGVLWVALAEKAYAEANGAGLVVTSYMGWNYYNAMNGGDPAWALQAITGNPAGDSSVSNLATAWQNGKLLVVGTPPLAANATSLPSINGVNVVPWHCYAVVGYDSYTGVFTLFNPWGVNGCYDVLPNGTWVFCGGKVKGTESQIAAVFSYKSKGSAAIPSVHRASNAVTSAAPGHGEGSVTGDNLPAPTAAVALSPVGVQAPSSVPAVMNQTDLADAVFFPIGGTAQESPTVGSYPAEDDGYTDAQGGELLFGSDSLT